MRRRLSELLSRLARRVGLTIIAIEQHAWLVVAVLAVVALMLGSWGFQRHLEATQQPATWSGSIYLALQLFTMNSGGIVGPIPWSLEVARFLAPVVAAGAAARALALFFYSGFQTGLLRLFGHDHIIVCGVGRKGAALVEELREQNYWVVVIESDPNLPGLERCRALGATVLIGSATDPFVLRRARVWRARALVAVTGTDGANIEVAVAAHTLNVYRHYGALRCVVHIVNRGLRDLLARSEMGTRSDDPFELVLFNVHETCARVMLDSLTIARGGRGFGAHPEHLLVVGLGQLGQALVLDAVARAAANGANRGPLRLTAIDVAGNDRLAEFAASHPAARDACVLSLHSLDVHHPEFDAARFIGAAADVPVSAAFVCLGEDSVAMFAALRLCHGLRDSGVPVFVRMSERGGLAAALRVREADGGFITGIQPVGLLDIACRADLVLGDAHRRAG